METITANALDLSVFLNESELTKRRAFIESFVKEIVVMPGNAFERYTIPCPTIAPYRGEMPTRWPYMAQFCLPSNVVEPRGFEPLTPCLQSRCSPN